jgi:hypothetical protein
MRVEEIHESKGAVCERVLRALVVAAVVAGAGGSAEQRARPAGRP